MSNKIRHMRTGENEVNVYKFAVDNGEIKLRISSKVEPKQGDQFHSDMNGREYLEFDSIEFLHNHMTTGTPIYECTMKGNPKFLPLINA